MCATSRTGYLPIGYSGTPCIPIHAWWIWPNTRSHKPTRSVCRVPTACYSETSRKTARHFTGSIHLDMCNGGRPPDHCNLLQSGRRVCLTLDTHSLGVTLKELKSHLEMVRMRTCSASVYAERRVYDSHRVWTFITPFSCSGDT